MAADSSASRADCSDPTIDHLVACCRGDADDAWPDGNPTGVFADHAVSVSLHHRVLPQLCKAWKSRDRMASLPPSVRERLDRLHLANAARGTVLVTAAKDAVTLFERAGVRAFPFKGPVLALQLHGDANARMLSDVDFLVHEADLGRARSVLSAAGWREGRRVPAAAERVWVQAGWGHNLDHPNSGAVVNLRSSVTPDYLPGRIDWDALWAGRRQLAFDGIAVQTPPEDALPALLAWHGAKHAWSRLVWLCDLDALVRRGRVADWDRVLLAASSMGVRRSLNLGLLRAAEVFETPVPQVVLDEARRDVPEECVEYCRRRFAARQHGSRRWLSEQGFYLRLWGNRLTRGARVLKILFQPTVSDYEAVALPEGMAWMYPVLRPFRLAAKVVGRAGSRQD
jgi:hypothetical protein